MPCLATPPIARHRLIDLAQGRWNAIGAARPDLKPAIELQQRLLTLVIGLAHALNSSPLPRLSLPPKYLAAKLSKGVPVFAGEPIPLPLPLLAASLPHLCDDLAAGGAGDAARHIRSAIEDGTIDTASLLAASFARDQASIRSGAAQLGLAADLMWLVAELAVSPFAHAMQWALLSNRTSDERLAGALAGWDRGYCAACGSRPTLAEIVDSRRILRCSFCGAAWERTSNACVYCGESGEPFVTAAPDRERTERRIEACGTCTGYLKTLDVPELSPFPLVAIGDLETVGLDIAAMERGYVRPPLTDSVQPSAPHVRS